MPWSSIALGLSALQKLALLQGALESAFRDTLTLSDKEGRVLYTNRRSKPKWRWRKEKLREQVLEKFALQQLPDDLQSFSLEGIVSKPIEVTAAISSPCHCGPQDEVLASIAHMEAEHKLNSGGDEGPKDRTRAVEIMLPLLPSPASAEMRPPPPALDVTHTHVRAEVAADPFARQLLVQNVFDAVPAMLAIIREMPGPAACHQIVMINTALTSQSGWSDNDLVQPPDPSGANEPLRRLIHPDDFDLVEKFIRGFFKKAKKAAAKSKEQVALQQRRMARAAAVAEVAALEAARFKRKHGGEGFSADGEGSSLSPLAHSMESPHASLLSSSDSSAASSLGGNSDEGKASPVAMIFAGEPRRPRKAFPHPRGTFPKERGKTAGCASVSTVSDTTTDESAAAGAATRDAAPTSAEVSEPEVRAAVEFRLMRKDGAYIWCRGQGLQIACPFDGTFKLALALTDVEERRSLRSQLEDERNVVSSVVDQLPVAVAVATPDGREKCNDEMLRVFGLSPGTAQSPPLRDHNLLKGEGEQFSMGGDCELYRLPPSIPHAVSMASSVLTGSLEERRSRDSPPAAPSAEATAMHVREACEDPDDPISHYAQLLQEGKLQRYPRFEYPLSRTILKGETVEEERAVIHNRETNIFTPITICSRPVYTHKGDLVAGVATIQDISSIVREEKAKGELVVAEQAAAATRDLLSVASHESRTPLAAILAMTSFLEDGPLTAEQKECVDAIKESGRLLLTLISDLLDFNRIEAGKLELERRLFSPYELLRHVTKMMASYGKARNITVDLATEDHDLFKRCLVVRDSQRLSQIVFNLASNACKFSNVGGKVVIRASAQFAPSTDQPAPSPVNFDTSSSLPTPLSPMASPVRKQQQGGGDEELVGNSERIRLQIVVVDQGRGMSKQALAKIRMFLPFTQENTGVAMKAGGFGLGLNISQKLLALMGSTMEVDSEEGHGSSFSFTVTLPGKVLPANANLISADDAVVVSGLRISAPVLAPAPPGQKAGLDFSPTLGGWSSSNDGDELGLVAATKATAGEDAKSLAPRQMPKAIRDEMTLLRAAVSPRGTRSKAFGEGVSPLAAATPRSLATPRDLKGNAFSPTTMSSSTTSSPAYDTATTGGSLFTWQGLAPLAAEAPQLPLTTPSADFTTPSMGTATATDSSQVSQVANPGRYRILVAEDNKMNQKIMLRYLAKLGFAGAAMVTVVEDGNAAVQELKRAFLSPDEKCYDLVLMDCLMPQYDGYWGCRAIRALPYECSNVSVVAVTASTLQSDIDRAAISGFNGHLSKPYTAGELKEALDRWMPKTPIPWPHAAEQAIVPLGSPPGSSPRVRGGSFSNGHRHHDALTLFAARQRQGEKATVSSGDLLPRSEAASTASDTVPILVATTSSNGTGPASQQWPPFSVNAGKTPSPQTTLLQKQKPKRGRASASATAVAVANFAVRAVALSEARPLAAASATDATAQEPEPDHAAALPPPPFLAGPIPVCSPLTLRSGQALVTFDADHDGGAAAGADPSGAIGANEQHGVLSHMRKKLRLGSIKHLWSKTLHMA